MKLNPAPKQREYLCNPMRPGQRSMRRSVDRTSERALKQRCYPWLERLKAQRMTIGIGVIGTGSVRGDTLVMISDTLGSTLEDAASTQRCHKMFVNPKQRIYIVAADNMNKASELVPRIVAYIDREPSKKSEAVYHAISSAMFDYHKLRANNEVVRKYNIAEWEEPDEAKQFIREECWKLDLGCELIVGTFDDDGRALLFKTYAVPYTDNGESPCTLVYLDGETVPGFSVVGKGGDNALFWLNYRDHTLSYSDERAAYHAYEAKRMAENSPTVNERIEMLIATKYEHHWLNDRSPESGKWSIGTMREKFAEFGPKSTDTVALP